jgi:hypothetical protein
MKSSQRRRDECGATFKGVEVMKIEKPSVPVPDWLYTTIVASLGIYFIIGGIVWSVLILTGRSVPDSFATILATIAGGLVGLCTPSRHRRSDAEDKSK